MSVKLGVEETAVNALMSPKQVVQRRKNKRFGNRWIKSRVRHWMEKERVNVGGDLNGHIGRSREGTERIHGG